MKKMIVVMIGILALTSQASASWYQEHCSNGEGAVKMANGHNDNYVRLKVRRWTQGTSSERVLELRGDDYDVQVVSEQKLSSRSNSTCGQNRTNSDAIENGLWTSQNVSYRQITLTLAEGKLFPEGTVGASRDRKTVEAHLICETNMNGMVLCPKVSTK